MWSLRNKSEQIKNDVMVPIRQNQGLIWLLSAGTFILTVLIVLGLFWAGRWALHKVTDEPLVKAPAPGISNDRGTTSTTPPVAKDGVNNNRGAHTTPTPATTPVAPQPATSTPTTQASQPTPSTLINTGPTSDD